MYKQLFNELASNNSRLFKQDKLNEYKDDKVLARILSMGLDPHTNYYIRKIPVYTENDPEYTEITLDEALNMLKSLSDRTYTGNAGIDHLKRILSSVEGDNAEVIEKIIDGDFKCGVSTSTINKTFPKLISEYPCMLASTSNKKVLDGMVYPARFDKKLDGMRFNALCVNGDIQFKSRRGRIIDLLGNLVSDFHELNFEESSVVYDGELWVDDGTGNPLPRKIGNGIITKAIRGTISPEEAKKVRVTLWDRIDYNDWLSEKSEYTDDQRLNTLKSDFNQYKSNNIFLIEHTEVNSFEEAYNIFEQYLTDKEEGGILKNKNSIWESKRSKNHIKFKAEREADLLCVGWTEGNNKYEGMIGNLLLESSDGVITVSCGSGLNDEDRKRDPNDFIGKIIEIQYNERVEDDKGNQSLFLPIFKFLREDKSIANSSKDLK